MLVIQSPENPGSIRNALSDLLTDDLRAVRIAAAYVTKEGSELVYDAVCRQVGGRNMDKLDKVIIASLDYGLTDPAALAWWRAKGNCRVFVAGSESIARGTLKPKTSAFHPKLYVFERRSGRSNLLSGSANMTGRGLSLNTEAALARKNVPLVEVDKAFSIIQRQSRLLDDALLLQYRDLRCRRPPSREMRFEVTPVAKPNINIDSIKLFWDDIEANNLNPAQFDQMWVEALRVEGGSANQLEIARGSNRFFGFMFTDYDKKRQVEIGTLGLNAGRVRWIDRTLSWHGKNGMERLNLPTLAKGGYSYAKTLVLFRRISKDQFELVVAPTSSDLAKSWQLASIKSGLVVSARG